MTKAEVIKLIKERFNVVRTSYAKPTHTFSLHSCGHPCTVAIDISLSQGAIRFNHGLFNIDNEAAGFEYDNWQDAFRMINDESRRINLAAERAARS